MNKSSVSILDGFFESPHDDPPRWAFMLTAYFDESFESPRGYAVMAGFLGNKDEWTRCATEWRAALKPRRHLHMNMLRWKNDRPRELLEKLGPIPSRCGLRPVYASVRVSDYIDELPEYATKEFTKGYFVTLVGVATSVLSVLPKGERVEFVFEEQREFAAVREHALGIIARNPLLRAKDGKSALAKWSSAPKSSLVEPSDYLSYALMHGLVDPNSNRTRLCSPIAVGKPIGGQMSKEAVAKVWR